MHASKFLVLNLIVCDSTLSTILSSVMKLLTEGVVPYYVMTDLQTTVMGLFQLQFVLSQQHHSVESWNLYVVGSHSHSSWYDETESLQLKLC